MDMSNVMVDSFICFKLPKNYGARYSQDRVLHPYVDMIELVH